jgi:hypothetical protein
VKGEGRREKGDGRRAMGEGRLQQPHKKLD